jgi:hypothetical protein
VSKLGHRVDLEFSRQRRRRHLQGRYRYIRASIA